MSDDTQTQNSQSENNQPDYIAKQYRVVPVEEGYKTRAESIGAAWKTDKGIMLRLSGQQVIDNDLYLFPIDK